jgi:hypothetical protein
VWQAARCGHHGGLAQRAHTRLCRWHLVGLYFVLGVHYRLLAGSPSVGGAGRMMDRARTFGLVFFERSFVEAVAGRRARDLLAASSMRGLVVGAGVVVVEAALVGLTISAWRRRAAIETAWLAAICGAMNATRTRTIGRSSCSSNAIDRGPASVRAASPSPTSGCHPGASSWSRHDPFSARPTATGPARAGSRPA